MAAWLILFSFALIKQSLHWPRIHDGPVVAYMVYLMDHGFTPYKDIIEVQFPGSLLVYWISAHLFGPSLMGFRLFDLCAMGLTCLAILLVSRNGGRWFSGVFSCAFLIWLHVGDGTSVWEVGQRDFIVACLVVCAAAALIVSIRRNCAGYMLPYGFCIAVSASIKPTTILYLILLVLAGRELRKRQERLWPYAFYCLAGIGLALGIIAIFLLEEHAFGSFFVLSKKILPVYTSLAQVSFLTMLLRLKQGAPFLLVAGLFAWKQPEIRRDWVQQTLLLSALLGAATYFIQHKGFTYHRSLFSTSPFGGAGMCSRPR